MGRFFSVYRHMVNKYKFKESYVSTFLKTIKLKKQYLKELRNKLLLLKFNKENSSKRLSLNADLKTLKPTENSFVIMYIVSIVFSKTNTLLHVMDYSGRLKFFYSAGSFNYAGKIKKARSVVFKKFYRVLVSKLKFLKNKPISLHLTNVGPNKFWIVKKLKKRLFIKIVKNFSSYPYNGCRKKKVVRKKFKKKAEEMAER